MPVRVSVFTPSHAPDYLDDCFRSLRAQTLTDWEWVVLLNGDAQWEPAEPDPRVKVLRGETGSFVGAIKREAVSLTSSDLLVELDHDDLITADCLELVVQAFDEHPEAVFVYSDFAQVNADGTPNVETFNPTVGWEYAPVSIDGLLLNRCVAFEPSPHNVSYIWYAPNHVRAFRRSAYDAIGGYDADLEVLDDQDLMMRLYAVGEFHRIPRCLYLQRLHSANTQRDQRINAAIQADTVTRYFAGIQRLAIAWAKRRGLAVLDLHVPSAPHRVIAEGAHDLAIDPGAPSLPYGDGEVGVIIATELLQRVEDRAALFAECHRVLVHGGLVLTMTPSTDGRGAFQDPTHTAYWNENSFWYLTQAALRDRTFPGHEDMRFQISGIRTWYPTDFEQKHDIKYVAANLLAVKAGPRQAGPLLC